MFTQRYHTLKVVWVVATLALGAGSVAHAEEAAAEKRAAETEPSWHSPSLTMGTVTGPQGAITTRTALEANALWGITETKVAEKVVDGV